MIGTDLPPSLLREGQMMRDSLLHGLLEAGHSVTLPLDPRAPMPDLPEGAASGALWPVLLSADPDRARVRLRTLVDGSGHVLPIGPEGEPAFVDLCRGAALGTGRLLGSEPETLALAADKLRTTQLLASAGLSVPDTRLATVAHDFGADAVLKPRYGAGCQDTRLIRGGRTPAADQDMIVEPLIEGVPLSLTLLCAGGQAWLLTVNRQLVRMDMDQFAFDGLVVAGAEGRRAAMEPVAERLAAAMPGLFGLAGVDLVDTVTGPVVIEVNPRPTTACFGLAAALGTNPLTWLLDLPKIPLAQLRQPLTPRPVTVRVDD